MTYDEPKAMREIHEIQERIYKQEKHLPVSERIIRANRMAEEMIKKYKIPCKILQKVD